MADVPSGDWSKVCRYLATEFYPGEKALGHLLEDTDSPDEVLKRLRKLRRQRKMKVLRKLEKNPKRTIN